MQGHFGGGWGDLAGNDLGTGSGWKQSRQNQTPLCSDETRSSSSTAHLDTALAARLHLLFALSLNGFRIARQDSELHTIKLTIKSCSFVGMMIMLILVWGCFLAAADVVSARPHDCTRRPHSTRRPVRLAADKVAVCTRNRTVMRHPYPHGGGSATRSSAWDRNRRCTQHLSTQQHCKHRSHFGSRYKVG